ncbi:7-methylguanosine phosphate-specific 5'-nucleotidase A-like isoform X2 [Pecten maximus]|uniref:7-methylguanosine phosphate-specific 5'-nucleotidase A-like isoform X2 n=1 Tax=Pecten maximus TaxID=6579 RepID=UPI0014584F13|nr:7-methylguanosine phosphate-specific 5'-nucleotidase A-like isoform X2 [Pecten maximus]
MIEELRNQKHVHIRDWDFVKSTIENIAKDGPEKLQVVADFDRTLTKHMNKGTVCATCHRVLEEGDHLPEFFRIKATELRDIYFPLEMNPNVPVSEKIPLMIEWWTKAHDLLATCGITKQSIRKMVETSTVMLRDGCVWLFDHLHALDIPLLIFSAGIGDVLEEVIRIQATHHSNMKVVSNYMTFDECDRMVGFQGEMIHVYNKNENAIHNSDYFSNLEKRSNILLLGDGIGDLRMADGATNMTNKLTIGFLNVKIEESLELYMSKYDIVICADESMDVVNSIMKIVTAQ